MVELVLANWFTIQAVPSSIAALMTKATSPIVRNPIGSARSLTIGLM